MPRPTPHPNPRPPSPPIYDVDQDGVDAVDAVASSPRIPGSPTTPGGRPLAPRPLSALELVDEVVVTPTKKAADRIALLPRLDKVVLLAEGVMSFHAFPSLAPLNVHQFPSVRGVSTIALDEDELAGGGVSRDAMHICVFKRRTVHWIRVTNEGISSVKDLPLRSGALVSVFRRGRACVADAENYSIVDLEAAEALPLLPISQAPHPDPLPAPAAAGGGTATPPPLGGPDPRQRPAIACVAENEFLIASHTGSTTLGVFLNEVGEPCRGTLEWASNLRSLVIDSQYSIALLHNNTIEIHSIHTQEIVQVVTLPSSTSSAPPSPLSFQPRSLLRSALGLELGSATGAHKIEPVTAALLPSLPASTSPPETPTKRKSSRASISSAASLSGTITRSGENAPGKRALTRVLVVGRNGLYALSPLTLVVQADALIDKGREDDALALADNFAKSAAGGIAQNPELAYVYLRLAYLALGHTRFEHAFDLFLRAGCDPRLVVRLFADLRAPLIGPADEASVCRGVEREVRAGKGVEEYILDNLNRNYSPHLKPDVEHAATTVELRSSLRREAREALASYLARWRAARRSGEGEAGTAGDSRKVDMVVDTTLVRLLAEQARPDDIRVLLAGANDCVLPAVEDTLRAAGMYTLLAGVLYERGETARVLEIYTKIVDGEYPDPAFVDGVHKVFDLVWWAKDKALVERYGLWMLKHDVERALRLFTDPKQGVTLDTRDLFRKMAQINSDAADRFLEVTVLQERDTDARLHADLVKRYIGRLRELLDNTEAKSHLREQESAYAALAASSSTPPTFLSFLASRYSPNEPYALLDRVRLKAILFLGSSSTYDVEGVKADLEEMEMRGMRGLALERVIVYGKLRLDRQALSLLLHTLRDLASAETYALQGGDPLLVLDVSAASAEIGLAFKRSRKTLAPSRAHEEQRRREGLARLLVDMVLAQGDTGPLQVAQLLETQAVHLDTLEVLPSLSDDLPLALLSTYLSRALRRSLHVQQEASILKALALGQNLGVQERVLDLQARRGPTVQLGEGSVGVGGSEKVVLVAKGAGGGESAGSSGEKGVASLDEAVELDLLNCQKTMLPHPGSIPARLHAALRAIHLTPPRTIASPATTKGNPGAQKRASVAIIIRLRPEHPPPTSTAASSVGASPSPHAATVPLQPSPPSSPGPLAGAAPFAAPGDGAPSSAATSSIGASPAVVAQLDDFFAQPWVNHPNTLVEILYIKRATRTTDTWSGHVAFPGGRSEPDDESAEFTALRETWEEVGLDLAEKDWLSIGQLDDREITTSLGKRLLMILSPYVFLHTSPYPPIPELQESEVASAHWIPLDLLHAPAAKYGSVPIDIATRLAPRNRFARWALHMLVGKMDFKCILLPNDPVAVGQQLPNLPPGVTPPELKLWGLTLGMTLDLLSHMTLPASPGGLETYPYDTPLGGPAGASPQGELAPFAPAEASIFPRFSYPDINFLIWLFAFRYRRLLRHSSHASARPAPSDAARAPARAKAPHSRVNWAGMSLNAYYAAVRRALVVAVFLRATAALGGVLVAGLWLRRRMAKRAVALR
ncbi:hypothetical protein JCM3770_000723 [Rhodotorula araucariae]